MSTNNQPSTLEKIQKVVSKIEIGVGIVMMCGVGIGVALQVLQRYLSLTNVGWSGELAMMSLVVLSLLTAGYLAARDEHITLEFIDGVLTKRGIAIVWFISRVIMIVVALFFAWAGFLLVNSGVAGNMASVAVPKAPFFAAAAIGFILVACDLLLDLVIKKGRKSATATHDGPEPHNTFTQMG